MPREGEELVGHNGFRLKFLRITDGLLAMEATYIPARTPHQMAGDGPARLRWEVRPALRTAEFFERAYSDNPGEDFLLAFAEEFQLT